MQHFIFSVFVNGAVKSSAANLKSNVSNVSLQLAMHISPDSLLLQTTSQHHFNAILQREVFSAGTLDMGRTQAVLASVAQSGVQLPELIDKHIASCCKS